MALHEQRKNDGLFLSVKHGGLCLELKPTPETETEIANAKELGFELITGEVDGKPYAKYVHKFASMDGHITKVEWYERTGEYGSFRGLKLMVKDGGEHYWLDLPFEKRPYDYFTKVAENIDYAKPVEMVAWPDKQHPKSTAFAIKQDGKFVQWKYTKDNMGDCPDAKQLRTGKWSFDDQREWLLDNIINVVIPMVDATAAFAEPIPEYTGEDVDEERVAIQEESKMKTYVQSQQKAKSTIVRNIDDLDGSPDAEDKWAPPEDID